MRAPIRSHGRDPLHRGSASHKPDGVQAARGRLSYSEAEKSECGTVPMHRTGTAAANAEGSPSTRMESSSSPISSHHPAGPKTGDRVDTALKRVGNRAAGSHVEKGVFLSSLYYAITTIS
jgi:hypothetical protein